MMRVYTLSRNGLNLIDPSQLPALLEQEDSIIWIDVDDPMSTEVDMLAKLLHFHPLAIEDTRNDYQRPKVEEYDDHLFIILNSLVPKKAEKTVIMAEVDIFLGRNYVVTARTPENQYFEVALERLQRHGAFRHLSSEYIFYVVIDVIIDSYFPALEFLDKEIENLEDDIIREPTSALLSYVLDMKRLVNEITRVTAYQENMFGVITRHQSDLFFSHDIMNYYLRDVHDHLIKSHLISISQSESLSSLVGLYMSSTANRLNFVVNRLTIATIVIGVFTVVSGFYGMNFTHTWPPYEAPWGLPLIVGLMIAAAVVLVLYFRRHKLL